MKKIIILFASYLLLISNIYSQGKDKLFSGGIVASPVIISWMKPDVKYIKNQGARYGYNFGCALDIYFNKNFAFSTGILLTSLSGNVKYTDSIPEFQGDIKHALLPNAIITYKLKYVEVPLSIKGISNEVNSLKYFCDFGFNPMILYNAVGDVDQENISGENVKNGLTSLAFGYHLGLGIQFVLPGNAGLPVELVYTNGLTNISKIKTYDSQSNFIHSSAGKIALNNIALKVGIIF